MSILQWDKSYAVGVASVDTQLEQVFSVINRYCSAVQTDTNTGELVTMFQEIIDYAEAFFAHEEMILKQNNYPDFDVLKLVHDKLLQHANELLADIKLEKLGAATSAVIYLQSWLDDHIRYSDANYRNYIKGAA